MTKVWVLPYIMRFPDNDGEYAQVNGKGYTSWQEASDARAKMREPWRYSIDSVEVQL